MNVGGSLIWLEGTENRTDKVIFDPGYGAGSLHVYEKVESVDVRDAQKEVEEAKGRRAPREDLPRMLLKARVGREPSQTYGVRTAAGMNERYE